MGTYFSEMKRRSSSKDGDSKKTERSQKPALRKGGKLIVAGAFSRFKTGHSPPIGKVSTFSWGKSFEGFTQLSLIHY